jgi:post-segregation antitoxin (ccd killing protein)
MWREPMGKVTIYVPDDLESDARAAGLPLSTLTQQAIREELARVKAKEAATADLEAVVQRLRGTIHEEEAEANRRGYADGVLWARQYANASELRYIARSFQPDDDEVFDADNISTIVDFFEREKEPTALVGVVRVRDTPYWHGFADGAEEVWAAVEKLL